MFEMRIVQAEFGDCYLLVGEAAGQPCHVLVDGGPPTIFDDHLAGVLGEIAGAGGKLELVMLSHVDNDHIVGLLDLMARLRQDQANHQAPLIGVDGLWHNSFARTIDTAGALEPRLRVAGARAAMVRAAMAVQGIGEGNSLRLAAQALGIPINQGFTNDLVCVDDRPQPVRVGNLELLVVGPTRANLDQLRDEWESWLDDHEEAVASGSPLLMANSDRSVPNLSSIAVLAKGDGKTVLCTGDGRSDHLLSGLATAGALEEDGSLHVDVLKVAHHGSDRDATPTFFRKVTADTYVISANGRDDNPDIATLIWIVEEAAKQERQIDILVTNETPSTKKLRQEYPPADYTYRLTIMPQGEHSMTLKLAP